MYRFLTLCFCYLLMSCYVYKPMEKESITKNTSTEKKEKKKKSDPILLTKDEALRELKQDAYYKIHLTEGSYKIRYKKSDRDSIYGHKKNCDKKSVSIAKKDIESIQNRRFSKLQSDLITYPILGGLAAGLLILIL